MTRILWDLAFGAVFIEDPLDGGALGVLAEHEYGAAGIEKSLYHRVRLCRASGREVGVPVLTGLNL
jgi:hypothetical protein